MINRVRVNGAAWVSLLGAVLVCIVAARPALGSDEGVPAADSAPAEPAGGTPHAARPLEEGGLVVPGGQEDLLAAMLGRGAALPEGCRLESGDVNGSRILSTYACPGGPVVLELRHPSNASSDAVVTDQFAVTVQSGSPPAGLRDTVVGLIRAREAEFKWVAVSGGPPGPRVPLTVILVGALLLLAIVARVLRRRRGAPPIAKTD